MVVLYNFLDNDGIVEKLYLSYTHTIHTMMCVTFGRFNV